MAKRKINLKSINLAGYNTHVEFQSYIPKDILNIITEKYNERMVGEKYDIRIGLKEYFEEVKNIVIERYHCHACDSKEPHFSHEYYSHNKFKIIQQLLAGITSLVSVWCTTYLKSKPLARLGYGYTALKSMDFPRSIADEANTCINAVKGSLEAKLVITEEFVLNSYIYSAFEFFGKKRYFATKELAQELANTVFEDIETEDVRFPNHSFGIYFEEGSFLYKTIEGDTYELIAGYVVEDLDVRLNPTENDKPEEGKDYVPGKSWSFLVEYKDTDSKVSPLAFQTEFTVPYKLLEVFNFKVTGLKDDKYQTYYSVQYRQMFNLIINMALYITNSEEFRYTQDIDEEYNNLKQRMLVAKGSKREKLKERMKEKGANPIVILGSSYIIDRTKQPISKIQNEKSKYQIKVRTLVSGHWRKQPYGKDNLHRKLLWIKPFWRGPKDAPISRSMGILK
jgi:hypothetical protein